MNEHERRIEAIRRVRKGEKVSDVCKALSRSRRWYQKWNARFNEKGMAGLEDQRKRNGAKPGTPLWLQELIVETRDRLVQQAEAGTSFIGISAEEVVRQLDKLDTDIPSARTVHRILAKAGRIPANQAY